MSQILPVTVTIPRSEQQRTSVLAQPRHVYVVDVVAFGEKFSSKRPFEDFEQLHNELTQFMRKIPSEARLKVNYALPPLPPTQWYKGVWNTSPQELQERCGKLESLMQGLVQQQDVALDPDERLWRFLSLSPCAAAACQMIISRRQGPWLKCLWESSAITDIAPLRHPSVEDVLVQILRGDTQDNADDRHLDVVCSLLGRIFSKSPESIMRSDKAMRERLEVLVGVIVRKNRLRSAATATVFTIAYADRFAWLRALQAFLDSGGTQLFLTLATVGSKEESASCEEAGGVKQVDHVVVGARESSNDGAANDVTDAETAAQFERLVAELLLWGFDGPVVNSFMRRGIAEERRKLLNTLFLSTNVFVQVTVGLLLGRLMNEPNFEDSKKAEAGLRSLCSQFAGGAELASAGLGPMFQNDALWTWLARLVGSPHLVVSGFSLLVLVHAVAPPASRIAGSATLMESLESVVSSAADDAVRGLAARTLVDAYREGKSPSNPLMVDSLCEALCVESEQSLSRDQEQHASLGVQIAKARDEFSALAGVEPLLHFVCGDLVRFTNESDAWKSGSKSFETTVISAESAHAAIARSFAERKQTREATVTKSRGFVGVGCSGEDLSPNLLMAEAELRLLEKQEAEQATLVEEILEQKLTCSREVSDLNEEAERWEAAAVEAEAQALNEAPGEGALELKAHDYRLKHDEAVRAARLPQAKAEELHQLLIESSAKLNAQKGAVESRRRSLEELAVRVTEARHWHTSILADWGTVLDHEVSCASSLRHLSSSVEPDVSQRSARNRMRAAIRELTASLATLDCHLEELEAAD